MINPYELHEVEFTYRCRIATYNLDAIKDVHNTIRKSIDEEVGKCLCSMGMAGNSESRMEQIT